MAGCAAKICSYLRGATLFSQRSHKVNQGCRPLNAPLDISAVWPTLTTSHKSNCGLTCSTTSTHDGCLTPVPETAQRHHRRGNLHDAVRCGAAKSPLPAGRWQMECSMFAKSDGHRHDGMADDGCPRINYPSYEIDVSLHQCRYQRTTHQQMLTVCQGPREGLQGGSRLPRESRCFRGPIL